MSNDELLRWANRERKICGWMVFFAGINLAVATGLLIWVIADGQFV